MDNFDKIDLALADILGLENEYEELNKKKKVTYSHSPHSPCSLPFQ